MTLRIREIGVRMTVHPPDTGPPTPSGAGPGHSGAPANLSRLSDSEREALLTDCVRLVLETLQRQEAR